MGWQQKGFTFRKLLLGRRQLRFTENINKVYSGFGEVGGASVFSKGRFDNKICDAYLTRSFKHKCLKIFYVLLFKTSLFLFVVLKVGNQPIGAKEFH